MQDTIGRITVSTVISSGQTFPPTTRYPFGFPVESPVIVHCFGSLDAKQEQRYKAFWESMQGVMLASIFPAVRRGGWLQQGYPQFHRRSMAYY
jgi:hypothetical protein